MARFENAGGTCTVTPSTSGGITCTSSAHLLKKDVTPYSDALSAVLGLQKVQYHLLGEDAAAQLHTGFIAQDLEKVLPDLVLTDKDGFKSVSYAGLTPYLACAIQQQEGVIQQLKTDGEITNLNVSSRGAASLR